MDLSYFEECVKNLELKNQSIFNLSDYVLKNSKGNENQIAKIIEKQFYGSHINHRIASFLLVNELFLQSSRKRDNSYLKCLSQRTKMFINDLAGADDPRADKEVVNAIEKWTNEGVFHVNFIKKLKETAALSYTRTAKSMEQKEFGQSLKYGKTFLMQIADLKYIDPCYKIYETYCSNKKIQTQLSSFYNQCKKIENAETPTQDQKKRAKQLLTVAKQHEKKLIKLVEDCQTNYKLLSQVCKIEYDKLPQSVKEAAETEKKQEKSAQKIYKNQ